MKSFVVTTATGFLSIIAFVGFCGRSTVVVASELGVSASISAVAFVISPLGITQTGARQPLLQAPNNSSIIIHCISAGVEFVSSFEFHRAVSHNGLSPVSVIAPLTGIFDDVGDLLTFPRNNAPTIISIIYTEN